MMAKKKKRKKIKTRKRIKKRARKGKKAITTKIIDKLVVLGKERGHLTYEEVNNILPDDMFSSAEIDKIMDVLVVPSLQEPFGRVLLEAMAMGKPVIASRVGGMPEIVSDGESGRLFPAKSPNSLANALREVLNSPDLAERWGNAGRERCEKMFSIQVNVGKTEDVYRKILKDQGAGA